MKTMSDREVRMRALLARYDACLTTEAEEQELQQLLSEQEPSTSDLQVAAITFEGLAALAEEQLPEREIEPRLPLAPMRRDRMRRWPWAVAAALLAVGCFVALQLGRVPCGYVNGEPIYDLDEALAYTDCLAELEKLDQSMLLFDRMMGEGERK